MASIANDPGGRRRILFVAPDGSRKTIRLGKVSQRDAQAVKLRVERLVASGFAGSPLDDETARWVGRLERTLAQRLARAGLIPSPVAKPTAKLEAFVESYISRRVDVSGHTPKLWRQTLRLLVSHFGADTSLGDITPGAAADWRLWLVSRGMADASVRKHCGFAKHFFAQAVDRELIPENAFRKLVSSPVGNDARQRFVTREETEMVLGACPNTQWRLVFALSRYGGLRCPSEHFGLKWGDVDWARDRFRVTSPKTARHAGHGERMVPLFPELRPYLEAAFDEAEPGAEYAVTIYRSQAANMRTQLARIIRQAGLTPWPRITQNLRASRATELAAEFPAHVAAAWLGHSAVVAAKHYWTVGEADFARAARGGAKSGALSAQKAAQQAHAASRTKSQSPSVTDDGYVVLAMSCDNLRDDAKTKTEVHGNRTFVKNTGKTGVSDQSGAECGALGAQNAPIDPDLATVVKRWAGLPEAIKQDIVAMVRAAGDGAEG